MTLLVGDRGIDYSYARPSLATAVKSGAKFFFRYSAGAASTSSNPSHSANAGKLITPAEHKALLAVGDVVANSEWYESRITEATIMPGVRPEGIRGLEAHFIKAHEAHGPVPHDHPSIVSYFATAGMVDGAADLALWRACGHAKGSSIYVSWDAAPVSSKWAAVDAYLREHNKALAGYYFSDAYAGTPYLKHALGLKLIKYGWRPNAGSWSGDGIPYQPNTSTAAARAALVKLAAARTPAHVLQTGNYWFANSADENLILRLPIGSHRESLAAPTPAPKPPAPAPAPTGPVLAPLPKATGKAASMIVVAVDRDTVPTGTPWPGWFTWDGQVLAHIEGSQTVGKVIVSNAAGILAALGQSTAVTITYAQYRTYAAITARSLSPAPAAPASKPRPGRHRGISPAIVRPRGATQAMKPRDVAKAYNYPLDHTGKGYTVGLIELGGGFPPAQFPGVVAVSVDGGSNTSDGPDGADGEVQLDIGVVRDVAPGAAIRVYFAPNTDDGFLHAIQQAVKDGCHAISISWGQAESQWSTSSLASFDAAFLAARKAGVVVFAASGDSGSTDSTGSNVVDFPASSPNVIGCGGTRLTLNADGTRSTEATWNDNPTSSATGGGVSKHFAGRQVPDVAGNADPETGYEVEIDGASYVIGGTSAVAPLYAALAVLLSEAIGQPLGRKVDVMNTLLTNLSVCYDVTAGDNGGYRAGPGRDDVTGLGVVDGAKLLAVLTDTVADPAPIGGGGTTPAPTPAPGAAPFPGASTSVAGHIVHAAGLAKMTVPDWLNHHFEHYFG